MAHYAFLDQNNIVTEVIVGKDEGEDGINWEAYYGAFRGQTCKRTSYNTHAGIHYDPNTNIPSEDQSLAFRKNYAGIDYTYDSTRNAFINPKPVVPPEDEQYVYFDEFACLWYYNPPEPNT
jgi:hypothetical protein